MNLLLMKPMDLGRGKDYAFSKTLIVVGRPMTTIIAILVIRVVIWHQLYKTEHIHPV